MEIIIAIIGALSAIFGFATFLIGRHDKKEADKEAKAAREDAQSKEIAALQEQVAEFEQKAMSKIDALTMTVQRGDLDRLMVGHPEKVSEIMVAAHKYFVVEHGDSWMKQVYVDYLNGRELPHPEYLANVD